MICPNCQFVETADAGFCSKCGQKFGPLKLTIRQFLGDLIDHVFNLDTNFFQTIKKIFIPGQLTLDFFAGHKKKYYHPLRLFFFLLVIHLGALGSLIPYDNLFAEINTIKNNILSKHNNRVKVEQIALTRKDANSKMALDSISRWFQLIPDTSKSKINTTSKGNKNKPTVQAKKVEKNNGPIAIQFDGPVEDEKFLGVPVEDLIILTYDSLVTKHSIHRFEYKLLFKQAQKFFMDPKGMVTYILSNMSWMMIVLIPTLSVFLKFLFRRRNRYYIEHLFYLYHWHAFAFLFGTILVVFFRNYLLEIYGPFIGLVILFGFIALKRYYKQGIIKSLIKFCMMGLAYLFLFTILILLTAVISFGFY